LLAISILDGRNWDKVKAISDYFSEYALIRYRCRIEIAYLIFLSDKTKLLRKLNTQEKNKLNKIWHNFTFGDALKIKEIEVEINHDVKAVEYFLKDKLAKTTVSDIIPFIHFGLTSYDINIPAYALMLSEFRSNILIPKIEEVTDRLKELIKKTKTMTMLGRTHGQPALPTTMGKELAVFYQRINKERNLLGRITPEAKLTGAVGNFNALVFAAPQVDWIKFSREFIGSLNLLPNLVTTQILPYDSWIAFFDCVKRLNNIFLNLVVDLWWYISFEYFLQKKKAQEVGSSTMSHKINPIQFENAEGNLGLANSILEFFGRKLSQTRLQRDLSDSTVKRNFGLAFGFCLLAWDSISSGLDRISPNPQKMKRDLDNHWEVFSEGIQTYLRIQGYKNAFELIKNKTRARTFTKEQIFRLIDSLPIKLEDKKFLKIKDLSEYRGLPEKLADLATQE